jgi:hypothetical protein
VRAVRRPGDEPPREAAVNWRAGPPSAVSRRGSKKTRECPDRPQDVAAQRSSATPVRPRRAPTRCAPSTAPHAGSSRRSEPPAPPRTSSRSARTETPTQRRHPASAHISRPRTSNSQVNATLGPPASIREPSQVIEYMPFTATIGSDGDWHACKFSVNCPAVRADGDKTSANALLRAKPERATELDLRPTLG